MIDTGKKVELFIKKKFELPKLQSYLKGLVLLAIYTSFLTNFLLILNGYLVFRLVIRWIQMNLLS